MERLLVGVFLALAAAPRGAHAQSPASAPVARVQGAKVSVTLDSVAVSGNSARVNLWIKPLWVAAVPGTGEPSPWEIRRITVRSGTEAEAIDAISRPADDGSGLLKSHADGTPAQPGESGISVPLPIPVAAGAARPASVDLVVTSAPVQRSAREFKIESLLFPARSGMMVAPRKIVTHADGSRLIVWKVGYFDAERQPLLAPTSPTQGALEWAGTVVVMEFRPARDAKPSPQTRFLFSIVGARDEAGRALESARIGTETGSPFSGHIGDVWRTRPASSRADQAPEDEAQRNRTRQTWYSAFFAVPHEQAKSLSLAVSVVEEREGEAETITLPNITLPAP